jgi:hypothetical protein
MRVHPASTVRRQRERNHHRPRPGVQLELVETAQHPLAMRGSRRRVPRSGWCLPGHRVRRHPAARPGADSATGSYRCRQCGSTGLSATPTGRNRGPPPESPAPTTPRPRPGTGTSPATPTRRNAAWSPATPAPAGPANMRRPGRPSDRCRQAADRARTDPRCPPENPAEEPPTRSNPLPVRCFRSQGGTITRWCARPSRSNWST